MALMTQAEGIAIVTETIFENRFMHAQDWLGWERISGSTARAIVAGPTQLTALA